MTSPQWPGQDRPASIDQYAPPRRGGRRALVGLLVVVVVAALVFAAWRLTSGPRPAAVATPTPSVSTSGSVSPTPVPTPGAAASSIPFVSTADGAEGTWAITKVHWTDEGVEISMRISVTKGTLRGYSFYLMENDSTQIHEAESKGWPDDISSGTIQAGQTETGRVFIVAPMLDSTVVLAHSSGMSPITALTIKG